jgi:hypothetical protein
VASAEDVFGAAIARHDSHAIRSICLNQEAVETRPSSVIPKRSASDDVEGCRVARARCFEHTPGRECCQSGSNLDHRASARFQRSAGGVNAHRPCGTHGRSAAKSVDAAEHRFTIWCAIADGSAGNQEKRCDPRSTVTSPASSIKQSAANRGESRTGMSRAFCDQILSRLFVALAGGNDRAISDTQPVSAAARTAAASSRRPRDSMSANSHSVFGYAHGPRSRIGPDRSDS